MASTLPTWVGWLCAVVVASASCQPAAPARSRATPARRSAPPPSGPPVEQTVAARYREFWVTVMRAGREPGRGRTVLAAVATGEELGRLLGRFAVRVRTGRRTYGVSVPRVRAVLVLGEKATVIDCHDDSRAGLADDQGRPVNRGRARQPVTASLQLLGGRWLVADVTFGAGSC